MKFELTTKTIHHVVIQHLEQVPADHPMWLGLKLETAKLGPERTDDDRPILYPGLSDNEIAFEENWLSEVTRTATDMLWMHDRVSVEPGEHFYLGHFTEDGSQVVVLNKEMDNYGADDIVYNGWRVTAFAKEVEWGLD